MPSTCRAQQQAQDSHEDSNDVTQFNPIPPGLFEGGAAWGWAESSRGL